MGILFPSIPGIYAAAGTATFSGTDQTLTGDVTAARIVDSANSAYFIDPAASGTSLSLAGAASISGSLTLPQGAAMRPAFGPTMLSYKSGMDAWGTGLVIQDGTGNVGIGTTGPDGKLTIYTGSAGAVTPDGAGDELVIEGSGNTGFSILSPAAYSGTIYFGNPTSNAQGYIQYSGSSDSLILATQATERMRINSTGNVGIGTTGPGALLQVGAGLGASNITTPVLRIGTGGSAGAFSSSYFAQIRTHFDSSIPLGTLISNNEATAARRVLDIANANGVFATFDGAGNVGIGTTGPGAKLDVKGAGNPVLNLNVDNTYSDITFQRDSVTKAAIRADHNGAAGGNITFYTQLTGGALTAYMDISNAGNVGIGAASVDYKLKVNGQPAANGYTAWTNYSDARLKTNITDIEYGTDVLTKISQLHPITFNYNELTGYDEETRSRRISGFIAQELQQVFPEMVGSTTINGTEYLDTDLSNLPLYLVKGIQELNARTKGIGTSEQGNVTIKGNVGIGTTSPSTILSVVQNSATDPIADAWTTYSSRRWKTDITPLERSLPTVLQLQPVRFQWKADGKHDLGMIAEDVGRVIPEAVAYEENGVDAKSIDYGKIVPLLVKSIQELTTEHEALKARVAALETR